MTAPRVVLVDSGGANIGSVLFALERLQVEATLSRDGAQIEAASHVILPGVGAAAAGMSALRDAGLDKLIPTLTQPVLGICLGMQLLFERSAEGDTPCLGVLPGQAVRFRDRTGRRVPHMGWNRLVEVVEDPLMAGIRNGDYAYFVHSYALPMNECTLAGCDYGEVFAAVVRRDNFQAAQFHPERSAEVGARLLRNFLGLQNDSRGTAAQRQELAGC